MVRSTGGHHRARRRSAHFSNGNGQTAPHPFYGTKRPGHVCIISSLGDGNRRASPTTEVTAACWPGARPKPAAVALSSVPRPSEIWFRCLSKHLLFLQFLVKIQNNDARAAVKWHENQYSIICIRETALPWARRLWLLSEECSPLNVNWRFL